MNNTGLVHWNGIFTRPRQTINWILEKKPSQLIILTIIFFTGVFNEVGNAKPEDYKTTNDLIDFLLTVLLHGGLKRLVVYTLFIWGINFCSAWFGGQGNFRKTQIALTLTLLLLFSSGFVLTVLSYSFSDADVFFSEIPSIYQRDFLLTYKWVYAALYVILVVWNIVLIVISISEVQKLSIWRSIASLVCGLAIIILPLLIITLVANPRLWYGIW